ncbi:MAG: acs [Marmoricola sp.]|nr:acs [Marmoricola sp.]
MGTYSWHPSTEYVEGANVTRLARANGLAGLPDLRTRSVADIGWYWDAVVLDLGLPFAQPYMDVVDLTAGAEFPDWFVGGQLNITDACLDRWLSDPEDAERVAVLHEAEDGVVSSLTYRALAAAVDKVSHGLRAMGVQRGDAVALFVPMTADAVIAVHAVARLGAVLVPLFSGFAPSAIAARIQDASAKAVIVADGTVRRGRTVGMKAALDEALPSCPSIEHVVVIGNLDEVDPRGAEVAWADLLAADPGSFASERMDAMDTLLLGYTSGTTGRPKGAVHTHAGFMVKTASEVAYSFDVGRDGVFCWITDMGWIMGPLAIFGTHANGATLLLYEGSPDVPDIGRIWDVTARHGVTMLGVSPTLIRAIRTGEDPGARFDLSAVHVIGSTGEPWDPDSYDWLARDVFRGRVPIINFSGGTEVGGSFLAPYPVEEIQSCSLGGPSLGMDVDVLNADGTSVRGTVGELVCRQPWPSMTRGIWNDRDRYLEAYWTTFPGIWHHGDFALADDSGQWFILGRSDDVMNVAGKRLAPAEVESVVTMHSAVAEAAAVGIPDPKKGEAVWVFWVPRVEGNDQDLTGELRAMVGDALGKPFAPSVVVRVGQLPKTRSAKILRRAIRAAALGQDPGDLSGAENPEAVDEIRQTVLNEL